MVLLRKSNRTHEHELRKKRCLRLANELPRCWKLSWHRRSTTSSLSGYKVKPFDNQFICPCCITAQNSHVPVPAKGLSFLRTTPCQSESQSCREGLYNLLLLLFLPDRLAWWVLWQMDNVYLHFQRHELNYLLAASVFKVCLSKSDFVTLPVGGIR